jgi:phenylalanyl-tRNA synthetase beta chain
MKVSLELLKQLTAGNSDFPTNREEIVERIGSQLGAVESVVDLRPFYQDALIVKVVSSKPILASDHLSVCLVDDKGVYPNVERDVDKLVQVVCGAPNVRTGQVAVWLPPGSIVPSSAGKDPLRIGIRKLVGNVSNGMLASAYELNIGSDHSGIVELPEDTDWGVKLIDYLHLDDWVVDIENKMFTHRPDLFGQLGIARELSAIYGRKFSGPEWYRADNIPTNSSGGNLSVDNRLVKSVCPRFMAVSLGGIEVGPSPLWLASYLSRCGIRPVNNIVDITNYVMLITAQPLHAYDLEKVTVDAKTKLIVRKAENTEKLKLIDGSEIELRVNDIVIATEKEVIGLAGIMGSKGSEVSASTKAIVLECANFDMYSIRRSSMEHGIFSEAVTRFNKGQSPLQCAPVLAYALDIFKQICPKAEIVSSVVDSRNDQTNRSREIPVELSVVRSYLGLPDLTPEQAAEILTAAEIGIRTQEDKVYATAPFWRTDLNDPVDIIEEIGRLYGYDRLTPQLPVRSITPPIKYGLLTIKDLIRNVMSAAGANELLSYSFTNAKLLTDCGIDPASAYSVINSLSPELKYYRVSLIPSLLFRVHPNHKAGYGSFALFELGRIHKIGLTDNDGLPTEIERLGFVFSSVNRKSNQGEPAYYQARTYLTYLLHALGISTENLQFTPLPMQQVANSMTTPITEPYANGRSAVVSYGGEYLGVIGEFNSSTRRNLKLSGYCAGFEIDLALIKVLIEDQPKEYVQLGRFPKVIQDLTVDSGGKSYSELEKSTVDKLSRLLPEDIHYRLEPIDAYRPAADKDNVRWTFRLTAESLERTLTDREISQIINKLLNA